MYKKHLQMYIHIFFKNSKKWLKVFLPFPAAAEAARAHIRIKSNVFKNIFAPKMKTEETFKQNQIYLRLIPAQDLRVSRVSLVSFLPLITIRWTLESVEFPPTQSSRSLNAPCPPISCGLQTFLRSDVTFPSSHSRSNQRLMGEHEMNHNRGCLLMKTRFIIQL